jgi:hypothetical protein
MNLSTDIKPRTDGTVRVLGQDGKTYTFKGEPLECDIEDEATLKRLLKLGSFFPSSDADEEAALALVGGDAPTPGDEDDGEIPFDPNAAPVEANTPPEAVEAAQSGEASSPPARRTRSK